jgi:hypothetical protein
MRKGDPPDAIEGASGSSGLQYNGGGYWQFNWKTPKDDANTCCRTVYILFNSNATSLVMRFIFRR